MCAFVFLQFDWQRSAGATLNPGTGPTVDHTAMSNQGLYMYADATGQNPGDRAWLFSPVLSAVPSGACVTFWYHMYGLGKGRVITGSCISV